MSQTFRQHLSTYRFPLVLLVLLVVVAIFPSALIERIYSQGLFLGLRAIFDALFLWLPFPALYLVVVLALFWIIKYIFQSPRSLINSALRIVQVLIVLVFTFQFFWGWNYQRISFQEQIRLHPERIEDAQLWTALENRTAALRTLRAQLTADTLALAPVYDHDPLVDTLRRHQERYFSEIEFPAFAKFRIRQLPAGTLLKIGTAGFYFPFTGEGHIDAGLHPLQIPFVTAHEMAHGYGIGNEGVCNYIAYKTLLRQADPTLNYIGQLAFWRYLASEARLRDGPRYTVWRAKLDRGIANDIVAIYEQMDRYPELFPRFRQSAYNAYLNAQGIPEGIDSYHQIVAWVLTEEGETNGD